MGSYLHALIALVLAVDKTIALDTPNNTVAHVPKISKEKVIERFIGNLEDDAPSTVNMTTRAISEPNSTRAASSPPYIFKDNPNLEWQLFDHSLPNGAVGIWNGYTGRYDYVCRPTSGTEVGFYSSIYGAYCFFPRYPNLWQTNGFYVLVNKDDFVFLQWIEGSHGSVPTHSVRSGTNDDGHYVAKNKYGLGLLHRNDAFYLPWIQKVKDGVVYGKSIWYKKSYQALVINSSPYSQELKNVEYYIDQADIIETPPFIVDQNTVSNQECNSVVMKVTLSATETKTNTWEINYSMTLATSTTISAGIPEIVGTSVTIGTEETFETSSGTSLSQSITSSLDVTVTVPPNHSCRVNMQGRRFTSDIPYKGLLGRTYSNSETKWTTIYGTYKGVQVADYRAEVERCEPLINPKPCE
ncbi:natterin-3-like [Sardina pilchardus]|uniref:natterin-3-like n=1 Tax=Sardina pilchardus TaxID=27697 RepID=UPI002E11DC69